MCLFFFFTTYKGKFSISFNLGHFGNSLLPFISRKTEKLEIKTYLDFSFRHLDSIVYLVELKGIAKFL